MKLGMQISAESTTPKVPSTVMASGETLMRSRTLAGGRRTAVITCRAPGLFSMLLQVLIDANDRWYRESLCSLLGMSCAVRAQSGVWDDSVPLKGDS